MSQYCSECGTANGPQATHCPRCGHALGDTLSLAATQALRRCERCGALSDRLAQFCIHCGTSFSSGAPAATDSLLVSTAGTLLPPSTIERGVRRAAELTPAPSPSQPGIGSPTARPGHLPDDWDSERTVLRAAAVQAPPATPNEADLPTVIVQRQPGSGLTGMGEPPLPHFPPPPAFDPLPDAGPGLEDEPLPPHLPDPPYRATAVGPGGAIGRSDYGPQPGGMSAWQAEQHLQEAFDHTVALPGPLVPASGPAPGPSPGPAAPPAAPSEAARPPVEGLPVGWLFAGMLVLLLVAAGFAWWGLSGPSRGEAQAGHPGAGAEPASAAAATATALAAGPLAAAVMPPASPASVAEGKAPELTPALASGSMTGASAASGPAVAAAQATAVSAPLPAAAMAGGRLPAGVPLPPSPRTDSSLPTPRPPADTSAKPVRPPRQAMSSPRPAAPATAAEPLLSTAPPTSPAPASAALPPATPAPAAAAVPARNVVQSCASAGGFVAQQLCRYRACEKAENARDATCIEMRRTEERNRGTDSGG